MLMMQNVSNCRYLTTDRTDKIASIHSTVYGAFETVRKRKRARLDALDSSLLASHHCLAEGTQASGLRSLVSAVSWASVRRTQSGCGMSPHV